ncbi:unnamed protein product [Rangifer tarandus platyrhynchus]|uniref:Uncharacterized protein n=1 Tax=Rangifer tarandus platyrhynchus TaxID=3082113 RepID=A0AC59YGA2_RANTA
MRLCASPLPVACSCRAHRGPYFCKSTHGCSPPSPFFSLRDGPSQTPTCREMGALCPWLLMTCPSGAEHIVSAFGKPRPSAGRPGASQEPSTGRAHTFRQIWQMPQLTWVRVRPDLSELVPGLGNPPTLQSSPRFAWKDQPCFPGSAVGADIKV